MTKTRPYVIGSRIVELTEDPPKLTIEILLLRIERLERILGIPQYEEMILKEIEKIKQ